jgi:hypothetical protein
MVGSLEFQELVSARICFGQFYRIHGGFSAGCRESDLLRTGDDPPDLLRQFEGLLRDVGEIERFFHLFFDCFCDHRVGMAENCGTPGQGIVDVFPSEDVVDPRSLAVREDSGEFLGKVELSQGSPGKDIKRSLDPTGILIFCHHLCLLPRNSRLSLPIG